MRALMAALAATLAAAAAALAPSPLALPCAVLPINTYVPLFVTAPYFASWNIDPSRQRIFFDVDFSDARLLYLVRQIGGARIRFVARARTFSTTTSGAQWARARRLSPLPESA